MENITLRTGKTVPKSLFLVISTSFELLFTSNVIMAYELVMLCRDANHELWDDTGNELRNMGFLKIGGTSYRVQEEIQDIVLASTDGDGGDLHLVNPLRGQ